MILKTDLRFLDKKFILGIKTVNYFKIMCRKYFVKTNAESLTQNDAGNLFTIHQMNFVCKTAQKILLLQKIILNVEHNQILKIISESLLESKSKN